IDELTSTLYTASGLLGLSGVSNDMRTVEATAAEGNERARLALDVFVHRLAKAIAAMVVGLGRLDALGFTAGIREGRPLGPRPGLAPPGFLRPAANPRGQPRQRPGTRGGVS